MSNIRNSLEQKYKQKKIFINRNKISLIYKPIDFFYIDRISLENQQHWYEKSEATITNIQNLQWIIDTHEKYVGTGRCN